MRQFKAQHTGYRALAVAGDGVPIPRFDQIRLGHEAAADCCNGATTQIGLGIGKINTAGGHEADGGKRTAQHFDGFEAAVVFCREKLDHFQAEGQRLLQFRRSDAAGYDEGIMRLTEAHGFRVEAGGHDEIRPRIQRLLCFFGAGDGACAHQHVRVFGFDGTDSFQSHVVAYSYFQRVQSALAKRGCQRYSTFQGLDFNDGHNAQICDFLQNGVHWLSLNPCRD